MCQPSPTPSPRRPWARRRRCRRSQTAAAGVRRCPGGPAFGTGAASPPPCASKPPAGNGDGGLAEQLAADEQHLRQVAIRYGLRKLSEPGWQAIRETLIPRIEAAHRRLQERLALPREAVDGSGSIREAWPKWTVEQKRAVLRALFHRILVGPATRRGRGPDPDRVAPPHGPVWKLSSHAPATSRRKDRLPDRA
jgi:hypothetical protein